MIDICDFEDCLNPKGKDRKFSDNFCRFCMRDKFNKYHIPKIILRNMKETYRIGQELCIEYNLSPQNNHPKFNMISRKLKNNDDRTGKFGRYSRDKNEISIFVRKATTEIRYLEKARRINMIMKARQMICG